jgi:lysophospholipase L1-like esterase
MPKPDEEFRIFLIGGSVIEGLYLDDSQSVNAVLQQMLNAKPNKAVQFKVYSAARSGDGIVDHIAILVHRIVHLQPDMIILMAGVNDLTRSLYNYDYLHFVIERANDVAPATWLKFWMTEFHITRLFYAAATRMLPRDQARVVEEISLRSAYKEKVAVRKAAIISNARPRTDLGPYRVNLKTMAAVAEAHGANMVFATQPSSWNSEEPTLQDWHWMLWRNGLTYREDLMEEALESFNDVKRQVASQHNIVLYDAARSIPKSTEVFYDDVHFNIEGARRFARDLAAVLTQNPALLGRK